MRRGLQATPASRRRRAAAPAARSRSMARGRRTRPRTRRSARVSPASELEAKREVGRGFPRVGGEAAESAREVHRDASALHAETNGRAGAVAAPAGDTEPQEEELLECELAARAKRRRAEGRVLHDFRTHAKLAVGNALLDARDQILRAKMYARRKRIGLRSVVHLQLQPGVADVEADGQAAVLVDDRLYAEVERVRGGTESRNVAAGAAAVDAFLDELVRDTRAHPRPDRRRVRDGDDVRARIDRAGRAELVRRLLLAVVHEVRGGGDHARLARRHDD